MNKLNKQQQQVLNILREQGEHGMNSFEYRKYFIQLPVRIKELKKKGYSILVKGNPNRSVNYILVESNSPQYTWEFVDGKAIRKLINTEPVQEVLYK